MKPWYACGSRPEVTSRVSVLIGPLGFFDMRTRRPVDREFHAADIYVRTRRKRQPLDPAIRSFCDARNRGLSGSEGQKPIVVTAKTSSGDRILGVPKTSAPPKSV